MAKLIAECIEDKELLDSLCPNELARFEAWFHELNQINAKADRVYYNGENLESSTGIKCWFDFFVNGDSPKDALDEDYQAAIS